MPHNVDIETRKRLDDYLPLVGEEMVHRIRSVAEPLRGARILHVNSTSFGGGVAEILQTLVPLMRDLGLHAEWQVIEGGDEFFDVTKAMHNGLQGMDIPLTEEMKEVWRKYNELNARKLEGDYDFIVVHDPQPAGLFHFAGGQHAGEWIWRCHIDTSHPNEEYWRFLVFFIY
jgi:trehalose synthase